MIPARWRRIAGTALIVTALGGCASRDDSGPERVTSGSLDRNPATGTPARSTGPERVTFDSLDHDPATGVTEGVLEQDPDGIGKPVETGKAVSDEGVEAIDGRGPVRQIQVGPGAEGSWCRRH